MPESRRVERRGIALKKSTPFSAFRQRGSTHFNNSHSYAEIARPGHAQDKNEVRGSMQVIRHFRQGTRYPS